MGKLDIKGLLEVGKELLSGEDISVPEEVSKERFKTCLKCPKLQHPLLTCSECGCFMKVKTKVSISECPLGKWGKYEKE